MFCYQCEQTVKGTGCTASGICGKDATTAQLQDLLLNAAKGVSMYAHRARELGAKDREIDGFVTGALVSTATNVNFDAERLQTMLLRAGEMRGKARSMYEQACKSSGRTPGVLDGPAVWTMTDDLSGLPSLWEDVSITKRKSVMGGDVASLHDLMIYGLKGVAAYVEHARVLGKEDKDIYAAFHQGLSFLTEKSLSVQNLVRECLKVGELNLKAMEMLDAAHTGRFGHPTPTPVRTAPVKGNAILVSGHDLKDLEEILEQTEGKGINVYTHGEMLPAHGYPKLKAYKHLVGNYGSAWQNQAQEFDAFPGAILVSSNCLQAPRENYKDRIFTAGQVAWPGVRHISNHRFGPVIEAALAAPGFAQDGDEQSILVGFSRDAVLGVADKVIEAVKSGAIRHFFLIGGCDGAKGSRSYYTELAQAVPQDCVVLTLACGKYRFNKLDFGNIGGIPRLLDIGQCNDAYSAIQIASALAGAFGCGVNDLPLSLILSWYEQKAAAILLTLLHLGIKNIRLGPSLPAFVSPNVLQMLVDNYNIMPISTPQEDLKAILG